MEMPKLSSKKVVTVAQERCLFMRGSNCNDLIVNVFSVFGWWLLYYYILLYYILATLIQEVFAAHSGFTVGFSCGESIT